MTKVSRIPMDRMIKADLISDFWHALGRMNRKEVETLLRELLSPLEVIMLAKRLGIIKLLSERFNYQDIARAYQVTPSTIAKMSLILSKNDTTFTALIEELVKDEKHRFKQFKDSRKPRWMGKMVHWTPR